MARGKFVIILRMKDALMLTACVLSSGLFASSTVAVPTLPPSEYADTEVSTNVSLVAAVTCAAGDNVRFFDVELSLEATPTNNVEIVFGRDVDGDGDLSRLERDFVLGWDSGSWFWCDRRGNVESRMVDADTVTARRTLRWRVTLDADHLPRRVTATEGRRTLCNRAATASMFSSGWDTARIVARGHVAHDESINVKTDRNAMRIILR